MEEIKRQLNSFEIFKTIEEKKKKDVINEQITLYSVPPTSKMESGSNFIFIFKKNNNFCVHTALKYQTCITFNHINPGTSTQCEDGQRK